MAIFDNGNVRIQGTEPAVLLFGKGHWETASSPTAPGVADPSPSPGSRGDGNRVGISKGGKRGHGNLGRVGDGALFSKLGRAGASGAY